MVNFTPTSPWPLDGGEVTPSRDEVKGLSLGNVERLCEALEQTGCDLPPLSPLVEATHTEVNKVRGCVSNP